MEGFLLKKQFRLRKNKEFQAVYEQKNSVAASAVVLYIRDNEQGSPARVGFSVSKRVGNAVVRNRCRRLLREAVRLHLDELAPGKDYVFIGRQSLAKEDFTRVEKDVLRALARRDCLRRPDETGRIEG